MIRSTAFAYNYDPLSRFLQKARRQRCAIISIENSNGYFNSGSAGGRVRAQRNAFAAAGLTAWGTHLATMHGSWGERGTIVTTGLSPNFDDFKREAPGTAANNWLNSSIIGNQGDLALARIHWWGRANDPANINPWNSTFMGTYATGATANTTNGGLNFGPVTSGATGLLDWTSAFTGHFWYSAKTPAGGTLRPTIRTVGTSTILAAPGANITVTAGTPSVSDMTRLKLNAAAGARTGDSTIALRWAGGYAPSGSNYLSYIFITQDDRLTGLAYGLYWAIGGTTIPDFVWGTADGNSNETFTISGITAAAAPVVTMSPAHGWKDFSATNDTELIEVLRSNSTPSIDGVWAIEVNDSTSVIIQAASGFGPASVPTTTVAGTSGIVRRFIRPIGAHAMVHQNHALFYPVIDEGQEPVLCVRLCDVLNMRNELVPPVQYQSVSPASADAFKIALRAAIATCLDAWNRTVFFDGNGNAIHTKVENICFWVDPDHPPAASDAQIASYIAAAKEVADEMPDLVTVTDTSQVVTYAEILAGTGGGGANSYFQSSGTDTHHLTKAGYEFVEGRKVAALMALPAPLTSGTTRLRGR